MVRAVKLKEGMIVMKGVRKTRNLNSSEFHMVCNKNGNTGYG